MVSASRNGRGEFLTEWNADSIRAYAKRLFSMWETWSRVALCGLVLTLPLWAVVAAWQSRLDSPGPILFRQERVGQNEKARLRC